MMNENELSKEVVELFGNGVSMTEKNDSLKEIIFKLMEERRGLKDIVNKNPNDMDLGKKIRILLR